MQPDPDIRSTRPTVLITGGTSGLGRIAARRLAEGGARLVLTARSAERAAETVAEIRAAVPQAETEVVLADFTRLDDVRRAGRQIAERHEQIDVLVNNAGLHAFAQRVTADGFPVMMGVNYLAPWLLTAEVLPSLLRTPGARVVNVASEASRRHGRLSLPGDLTDTSPFTARGSSPLYGKSKLLDILFTLELARRLEGTGVTANCLDPGFNVTGLGRELGLAARLERVLTALRIGDPERGAGLIVRLASDPGFAGLSGAYFTQKGGRDARIEPVHPAADPELGALLWAETERLLGSWRAGVTDAEEPS